MEQIRNHIDFNKLNQHLLGAGETFLRYLFPEGKIKGHEFCIGSINGDPGNSLKININSGAWCDFALPDGMRGGDLISLYAAKHGLTQGAAARELQEWLGIKSNDQPPPRPPVDEWQICTPPIDAPPPTFMHWKLGPAARSWPYHDADGRVLFHVSRYNLKGMSKKGKPDKKFCRWAWSDSKGDWVCKAWPKDRPLFGIMLLAQYPDRPVMLVEGEGKCEDARKMVGHVYIVMTWDGGAGAVEKTDMSPLKNREVLLWPDADKPGIECMREIAKILARQGCKVKMLNVDDHKNGWDAADALAEGWDWAKLREWAKPRVVEFSSAEITRLETIKAQAILDREKPIPMAMREIWDCAELITASGRPVENIENVIRLLNYTGQGKKIWYDTFHQAILFHSPQGQREWRDADTLALTKNLQCDYGFRRIGEITVFTAVRALAFENERDSVKEWFEALKWDGVRRNEQFFQDIYGAEDSGYTRDVGKNFLRTIVARATQPGCKVDNMVILQGSQGIGKSESLCMLGGGLHTETHESVDSKDFYLVMQGKLIVVIAEMDTFSRANKKKVKAIITNKSDRYRTPYGRLAEEHPRRCVFVGDTNEEQILDDETGGRRFWPIRCKKVNWSLLKKNREQYYAEAMHDLRDGQVWHIFDEEAASREQEACRIVDEWEPHIEDYLRGRTEVTTIEIIRDSLRIEIGKSVRVDQMRVGRALRILGWKKTLAGRDGKTTRIWVRKNS